MQRIVWFVFIFGVFSLAFLTAGRPEIIEATSYSLEEKIEIFSQVNPSPVIAEVAADAVLRQNFQGDTEEVGTLIAGDLVELIRDVSSRWYKVRCRTTDLVGFVGRESLIIPSDSETNPHRMSTEHIEGFVNIMSFKSATDNFVWVDIDRQLVHVLEGSQGSFRLAKTLVCATGINESPTSRGLFVLTEKGEWFYSQRLGSGGMYWFRFNGSYLFHSVAMDSDKNVIDGVLGVRRSSGCVRMSVEDARWFYNNIPANTAVFVH